MEKNSLAKKIVKWVWIFFFFCTISAVLIFVLIAKGKIGYMPPVEDLENPINKYASQVLSVDMVPLGTFSIEKENRIYVNYKDLSPALVQALVATEDARYYEHSGIDIYALVRAIVKGGIFGGEGAGGGSTISQQLAKLLYSKHAETKFERLLQKPVEWVIAVQLEKYYTKEEIINMYLNKFDFLYNAVGIQSACWTYFKKSPKDISTEEAATLIGMLKNSTHFNPIRRPEITRGRRNVVLSLMEANNYLAKAQCDSLKALPLQTVFTRTEHNEGLAPYFREYLRVTMTAKKPERSDYPAWNEAKFSEDSLAWETNPLYGWCNKRKKPDGTNFDLYTDGLKIYSTIDSRMQRYAEEAVSQRMADLQDQFFKAKAGSKTAPYTQSLKPEAVKEILERAVKQSDRYRNLKKDGKSDSEIQTIFKKPIEMTVFSWKGLKDTIMSPFDSIVYMKSFLRSGFMAMDTRTGAVKAYVGGIDYQYFKYDMATMGRRQIGSTVKPFLYSLAMESGMTPCDEMLHVEQTLITENGREWTPDNANKKRIGEMVSIRWGLQNSDNWVTAYIMKQLNPYTFARLLHSYGLKGPIYPVVSLALGSGCDASVSEMVSGYTTFANHGIRIEPLYVTRIEDRNGNILETFSPQVSEIINEDACYKMLSMLQSVIDGGTGNRIRSKDYGLKVSMGGKTGTTQNHSDGWFMGFTPSLVAGAWVGGEDRDIHFDRMTEGQGATMALPILGMFYQKVYNDSILGYSQNERFEIPSKYANPCSNQIITTDSISGPTGIDDLFK